MTREPIGVICAPTSLLTELGRDPVEGSEKGWCDVCADEIWVGPAAQQARSEGPVETFCLRCAPGVIDDPDKIDLFPQDTTPDRVAHAERMRTAIRKAKENRQ